MLHGWAPRQSERGEKEAFSNVVSGILLFAFRRWLKIRPPRPAPITIVIRGTERVREQDSDEDEARPARNVRGREKKGGEPFAGVVASDPHPD